MDEESILYTAEYILLCNLCLQYYNETDIEKKKIIYDEIQILSKKREKN